MRARPTGVRPHQHISSFQPLTHSLNVFITFYFTKVGIDFQGFSKCRLTVNVSSIGSVVKDVKAGYGHTDL